MLSQRLQLLSTMDNNKENLNFNIYLTMLCCFIISCSQKSAPFLPDTAKTELTEAQPPANDVPSSHTTTIPSTPTTTVTTTVTTPVPQLLLPPSAQTVPAPNLSEVIDQQKLLPLSWENKISQGKEFSRLLYKAILENAPEILELNSADDTDIFCSKYKALTKTQRLNFWGEFFVGLALHESSWHQTSRHVERTMGIDPITHQQIASEGLLQLSYQDQKSYNVNCGFDWVKDKNYSAKDMRKTIFDPYLNLRCGIKIFALQLKKERLIAIEKNVYWAVIRKHGVFSKISEISKSTQSLPFCQ